MKNNSSYPNKFDQLHQYEKALETNDQDSRDSIRKELTKSKKTKARYIKLLEAIENSHQENYSKALEILNNLVNSNNPTSEFYFYKGLNEYNLKQFNQVLYSCDEAIKLCSDYYGLYQLKASCNYNLGQFEDSLKNIDIAISLSKDNLNLSYEKGKILFKLKNFHEALNCFDSVSKRNIEEEAIIDKYKLACISHIKQKELELTEQYIAEREYLNELAQINPLEAKKSYFNLLANYSDNEGLFNLYRHKLIRLINKQDKSLPKGFTLTAEEFKAKKSPLYDKLKDAVFNAKANEKENILETSIWVRRIENQNPIQSSRLIP